MNNTLKILISLIVIFFVNVVFYFTSEDYRFFWEKIKNSDEVVYVNTPNITDEERVLSGAKTVVLWDNPSKTLITSLEDVKERLDEKPAKEVEQELPLPLQTEIFLGKNYTDILDKFGEYGLERQDQNYKLFSLTDEYPDPYFEYYAKNLTLYFFPTKSYRDVFDVFDVLTLDLPISLNQVNNFGDNSFYINLAEEVSDDNVRLIVSENWIVFWLKIKKSEYNTVKEILLSNNTN